MAPEILEKERTAAQETAFSEVGSVALQLASKVEKNFELTDKRIVEVTPISSPNEVISKIPQSRESAKTVESSRQRIINILDKNPTDDRLLVVIGPCSIHDPRAALEYAGWVKEQRAKFGEELEIVMRTYLEKPRTTTGWKGLINDPHLDGSYDMNEGLLIARSLLHDITRQGVPVATELLDTATPQYIADLISYGAIGARTTESQPHRELVSGTSFPVGFKNGTGGSVQIAINAMKSAASPHSFMGIDKDGRSSTVKTAGNEDCHIILRGSSKGPNYDAESVDEVSQALVKADVSPAVLIDTSHANSRKDYLAQVSVAQSIASQVAKGNKNIRGVMIESNLEEGAQKFSKKDSLVYGQSITDACVGLGDSGLVLKQLADAVRQRRLAI